MLLYISTCLVLLSVVKSNQLKPFKPKNDKLTNDAPKQADAIFADVIKNISRVNNVLQELINNYEHLQKIYKSQENVESAYSDSEIDEIFKSKKGKQSQRTKDEKTGTKKPNSERFAATRMFWSDHDEDNDSTDETKLNDDGKIKDNTERKPNSPVTKTTTLKPASFEESSNESSDTSLNQENVKKLKNKEIKKPEIIKPANVARPKPPKQPAEVIFVDTHRKPKEPKPKESIPTHIKKGVKIKSEAKPAKFVSIPTKPKTRYSKVSYNEAKKSDPKTLQPQNPKASINDTRTVKKITHSESFSPKKIWDDIISNKPIQLEAHNEITLRRVDTAKRNQTDVNKRTGNRKPAIMIITKNKKKVSDSPVSSEDDELTHKEELKTNVLRQAYGDACLKLVLRKCFKACKKVSRSVCNEVKCKSGIRNSFKTYSKTGCIKEFEGGGNNTPTRQDTVNKAVDQLSTNYRGQEGSFVDMTRGGFLSAACQPHVNIKEHKAILRNETPPFKAGPAQQFNILRDRFERACKKISSNKCNNACTFSYTKMCETQTCSKRMKKKFKKQCKSQCRSIYELFSRDSESSGSDISDSGSESEEDSDESGSSE